VNPFLIIENLTLKKEDSTILKDINLAFFPGKIHVLLGLNGSGKSSLAYALMGCEGYKPAAGQILMDGNDITNASITERARLGISLAWQEPVRFEGLPIGKYVGLGAGEPNREKVVAALEAVSLPAKTYGFRSADRTLSGGERKRVELASLFAMRPRLAILDEPDSGIDALSIGEVANLIQHMAQTGSAVLLITHRPELITIADTASLICLGSLILTGKPEETSQYYQQRCQSHQGTLGSQPWMPTAPLQKTEKGQEQQQS
jgi:Fe-S cluster assembly ATP-binding protein